MKSNASSKLKNVAAIEKLLAGEHRTQTRKTFGYSDTAATAERNKKRQVGETWPEYNQYGELNCIWEQKEGYRVKHDPHWSKEFEKNAEVDLYSKCLHEECKTKPKTRFDKKFGMKMNMCADCVFEMENKMKQNGTFKEYERTKLLQNAESIFREYDTEIEIVAQQLDNSPKIGFVNSDGSVDNWSNNKGDRSEGARLKEEYNQFKQIALEQLEKYGKPIEQEENV